jgi:antitoxin component YwqK of YwqJK toxin-antitoxin module
MPIVMKPSMLIGFFLVTATIMGQSLPNNFRIGNFFEVFSTDSVRIYFNCTGTVVDRNCASYLRIGRMDSIHINVSGEFKDYDVKGNLIFKATMRENYLDGVARYYHENGQIKEEGRYRADLREGKWMYYYSNGQVEKVLIYSDGEPLVMEYFTRRGKQKVANGNGRFRTEFSGFNACTPFETWGWLKDGKRNGKWFFYVPQFGEKISVEYYENGSFIRGISPQETYTDQPRITLNKFYPNQNLHLEDNLLGCPGDKGFISFEVQQQQRS